jgi:hypothetical protein
MQGRYRSIELRKLILMLEALAPKRPKPGTLFFRPIPRAVPAPNTPFSQSQTGCGRGSGPRTNKRTANQNSTHTTENTIPIQGMVFDMLLSGVSSRATAITSIKYATRVLGVLTVQYCSRQTSEAAKRPRPSARQSRRAEDRLDLECAAAGGASFGSIGNQRRDRRWLTFSWPACRMFRDAQGRRVPPAAAIHCLGKEAMN